MASTPKNPFDGGGSIQGEPNKTSGPPTAGEDNPLMAELDAITKQKKQGVVLVDDMDFGKERILADGILRIVL